MSSNQRLLSSIRSCIARRRCSACREASSSAGASISASRSIDSVGSTSRLRFSAASVRKIAQTSSGVE